MDYLIGVPIGIVIGFALALLFGNAIRAAFAAFWQTLKAKL